MFEIKGAKEMASTGGQVIMMSKVQCLFWSKNCATEGRGGEKGGLAKFKMKHTEPLT